MQTLLADIQAFTAQHGMPDSTFGRLAVNDWKFVRQLRTGRRLWPETEDRVRRFMAEYQPEKAAA